MEKLNINVNGNKKLRNTAETRFIIWNLPAVKTCPYATEMCKKSCYARKAERVYPQVLPSRERNYSDSLGADFVDRMIYTIESELKSRKYTGKQVVFRVHESGDFYNQEYAGKWVAIARHFSDRENLVFLAYTKSLVYLIRAGFGHPSFPHNFVVRSSLWADTSTANRDYTDLYNFPIYTALTRSDMDEKRRNGETFTHCRCDDCATCGECWKLTGDNREIICEIH